jgi:hypothetical protein
MEEMFALGYVGIAIAIALLIAIFFNGFVAIFLLLALWYVWGVLAEIIFPDPESY